MKQPLYQRLPSHGYPRVEEDLLSQIDEAEELQPYPGMVGDPQSVATDMLQIRMDFPFLPIIGIPRSIGSVMIGQDNLGNAVASELRIPVEVTIAQFECDADLFYLTFEGVAQLPTLPLLTGAAGQGDSTFKCLIKPRNRLFYLGSSMARCSVISPTVGAVVQYQGYITNKRPTLERRMKGE